MRLSSHRPYRLRDGDEIRLGQMVMKMYFQLPLAGSATDASHVASAQPDPNSSPSPGAPVVQPPSGTIKSAPALPTEAIKPNAAAGTPKGENDTGALNAAKVPNQPKTSGINTPKTESEIKKS